MKTPRIFTMKHDKNYQLELQSEACLLIRELYALCGDSVQSEPEGTAVMKQMLNFIQEHLKTIIPLIRQEVEILSDW